MKKVVFACAHNCGRSQMAAAFFNTFCAPFLVKAVSASVKPGDRVQPEVVEAMAEIGFDVGKARHQELTPELTKSAFLVVTFPNSELQQMPGHKRIEWLLADPAEQPIEQVRRIRDELRGKTWRLIAKEGWYKLQLAHALRTWAPQPGV
jgi:arsenate reductase